MRAEGIDGTVYSHAIGDHGHGAGPIVGLYDHQEGVPGRGDMLAVPSTRFSIALQPASPVLEDVGQPPGPARQEAFNDAEGRLCWVLERSTCDRPVAPPRAAGTREAAAARQRRALLATGALRACGAQPVTLTSCRDRSARVPQRGIVCPPHGGVGRRPLRWE